MKRRHVALALAFVSCSVSLICANRGSGGDIVEAAPRLRTATAEPIGGKPPVRLINIAVLRSRKELLGAAASGPSGLFEGRVPVLPLPPAAPPSTEVPPLPPAPSTPIMPFTYIGKQAANGVWEVYLARGDETLIVHEHTVIDSVYRVESIRPPTLSIVYLPLKAVQTMDIGSAN